AAGRRRPDALGSGLFADAEALGGVLVGPDVAPFVEPAELRIPSADEWREFGAPGDVRTPAVDDAGDPAGFERVDADFVEIAVLARLERRRERRGEVNIALLLDDEFACVGRPPLQLCRFFPQTRARCEVLVGPDMDDAIERAYLGVPKSGERRDLGPRRQRLG